ncbi:hypothetical protein B0T20DRAFT_91785 [Sordaria brevicollis]|uniref:Roadblock/LAMTOR2 domain-containing protein n=1 Tax=Sordaria brevicollis TaxID=83679 RepID=A0AAE0NWV4_SORBR|nr:hypothetical protein B0T20DRAFT_91785 [Sordaria brevicollis]
MSDPTSPSPSAHLEETLGRLSKKPGVKGAIVLDRASGAILKTSGQVSSIRKAKPQPQQAEPSSESVTDQQGPLSPSFPPPTSIDSAAQTTTDAAPGTAVTTTGEEAVTAATPATSTMVSSGTGMDGDLPGAPAAASTSTGNTSSSNAPVSAYDQNVTELAAMVWSFVSNAGDFVQELDEEDELKLFRLRTRKQELVIVPDAKYLLVVFHDTPPA